MTFLGVAGIIVLVALVLPPIVYLCIKLAAYAWLRGKQVFHDEQTQRREQDGD